MEFDVRRFEAAFGLKPRDWKREIAQRLEAGSLPESSENSLASAGYPELYRATIFLTDFGLREWENSHSLKFPEICCICGKTRVNEKLIEGIAIPTCEEHASGLPGFILQTGSMAPKVVWIMLTGCSSKFLAQTAELNLVGDMFPPWVAFPAYGSTSGFWKQGGQIWLTRVFCPFWTRLGGQDKKDRFLQTWSAPSEVGRLARFRILQVIFRSRR